MRKYNSTEQMALVIIFFGLLIFFFLVFVGFVNFLLIASILIILIILIIIVFLLLLANPIIWMLLTLFFDLIIQLLENGPP